jgi:hypothetical protein
VASTDTITIYRGEDVTLSFTMDPVVDITGWTLTFSVRNYAGVVFTKTATVTSAVDGTFTIAVVDTDSDSLIPGTYLYDVWRTDEGSERVVAIGSFVVNKVARTTT